SRFFSTEHATTVIYTLSLHDALPIWVYMAVCTTAVAYSKAIPTAGTIRFETITIANLPKCRICPGYRRDRHGNKFTLSTLLINQDRKSTRLNSSHVKISYAVFCLKKK